MTTLYAQSPPSPVITVRKGTGVTVNVTEISGAAGSQATNILKTDIQLSGALTLGSGGPDEIAVTGNASGNNFEAQAKDNTGGTVLQKIYPGQTRHTAHQFIDDLVETLTGQKGIALSKIAFVANRTGHKEIYSSDYDGFGLVQLTHDGAISVSPALSPDGRKLAYTGYQSGYADIYLVDLATGARSRIIKFPGTNSGAAFSPDGRSLACTMSKDGNPEIYIIGLNGESPHRVTRGRGVESSPTWSPNGSELIYCSDERGGPQLFRISLAGDSSRLLPTGFGYTTSPKWSPDGKKITFNVRAGGGFQVGAMDLTSGPARIVVNDGEDPVWGPDSRHILYATGKGLYMADTVSGRENRIVGDLGDISEPTWSR